MVGVGVEVGVAVTVAVGVDVTVAVGVDVGVAVAVGVTDGVGEAQGTVPMKLPNATGPFPTPTVRITVLLEVSITETLLS